MTPKKRTRNRAAQDSTLINLRAQKRRLADMERRLDAVEALARRTARIKAS